MEHSFKNILLAVDSLSQSNVAMQKACDLAEKFQANLTALIVKKEGEDEALDFLKNFTASKGIKFSVEERSGDLFSEALAVEKENDFDLIVLELSPSTLQCSLFSKSSALSLIHGASCPVLSIPQEQTEFRLYSILIVITDSLQTRQKVPYAAAFARVFGSTVHIFGTSKKSGTEVQRRVKSYVRQTERYLAERGLKYTVLNNFGVDVPTNLMKYAQDIDASLICKMTQSEDDGLLTKNYLDQCLKKNELPILSIKPTDKRLAGASGY